MVSSYKRGSDEPSRNYPQRSGRNSTFLGYRGRGSYFHDRQQLVASSRQPPESPSQPRTAPAETETELGRLDVIRKTLSNKGFSKQVVDIICASWTAGTEKQYKGVWDKWSGAAVINGKLSYFKLLSSRLWSS
ncbi:unnamed protein product [Porites evermanni]|uniref:Uncharacterized protein n=1 Tax=Porites evermanni TaxID=104178 RepID=A0ABN8QMB9_9CNID|nr:unnamed protein product [Porites evermanni]